MRKILYINKERFILWLYCDKEDITRVGCDVVNALITTGRYAINDIHCLEGMGYLPIEFVENKEDIAEEDIEIDEICDKLGNYILKYRKELKDDESNINKN